MKKYTLFPLIALMLCTTACGKQKEIDLLETYENTTSAQETVSGSDSHISDNGSNPSPAKYNVRPETSTGLNLQIYRANPAEFTDDSLKELAGKVFDNNNFTICKPFTACNRKELDDLLAELDAIDNNSEPNKCMPYRYRRQIEWASNNYSEDNNTLFDDSSCIASSYIADRDQDSALFKGQIDNVDYALVYCKYNNSENHEPGSGNAYSLTLTPTIQIQRLTPTLSYSFSLDQSYDQLDSVYGDNLVTQATAQKQAETFLSKLGYTDFFVTDYGKRVCTAETTIAATDNCFDGYSFTFTRQIDGVTCPIGNGSSFKLYSPSTMIHSQESDLSDDFAESQHDLKEIIAANASTTYEEFIRVDVDSEGVALVEFYNPYNVEDSIASESNILTYDQALDIFQQTPIYLLGENTDSTTISAYLAYAPTRYEEGYAFMPTWFFIEAPENYKDSDYYNTGAMTPGNIILGINAVDGSLITSDAYPSYSNVFSDLALD